MCIPVDGFVVTEFAKGTFSVPNVGVTVETDVHELEGCCSVEAKPITTEEFIFLTSS